MPANTATNRVATVAMPRVTIAQMKSAVSHFALGMSLPLMFWGSPGIGKTEGIAQACVEANGFLVDIRLGQYDNVDLRGLPDREGDTTRWLRPSTFPFKGNPGFPTDRPIFLVLDEINACNQAVFGTAYQLIQEGRVGEHELMPNVIVVAMGNREGDRGVVNKMPKPLCNRLMHFEAYSSPREWARHAQSLGLAEEFIAFFLFREPLLDGFDPSTPDKVYCTPRTAEMAARIFANTEIPLEWRMRGIEATVGMGVATELQGFLATWSKIPPMIEAALASPTTAPLPRGEERASMQYAMTIALSGKMGSKTVDAINTYLARFDAPEFVVMAWQLAGTRDQTIYALPQFIEFTKVYKAIW